MPKEYRIEQPAQGMNQEQEVEWLNKMSAEGWDFVQVLVTPWTVDPGTGDIDRSYEYYFERTIEINDKLRFIQVKTDQEILEEAAKHKYSKEVTNDDKGRSSEDPGGLRETGVQHPDALRYLKGS